MPSCIGMIRKLTILQVVEVDPSYRERVHNYQIHAYMYGQTIPQPPGVKDGSFGGENVSDFVLSPSSMVVNFGDLQIYRIGSGEHDKKLFVNATDNLS